MTANRKILVTGAAGFIGFHITQRLLSEGHHVVGLDNLNDYYEVSLKLSRLGLLQMFPSFYFSKTSIEDKNAVDHIFKEHEISLVIHLAAQAGVRHSINNPQIYIQSNIVGFMNILETCRHHQIEHFIYASSSSVYGANTLMPFAVAHNVDHPISLYAATKKANELMAHTYSHLYRLPTTGLRFFTVYGPWGRPDMALFLFTKAMLTGEPIKVFNEGKMKRDFTYIDDIVEGVIRLTDKKPLPNDNWKGDLPDPSSSNAPYKIFNIGNHSPIELSYFISVLEQKLGIAARKEYLPLQAGDLPETYADIADLKQAIDFKPSTSIEVGIGKFVDWYKAYYKT